MTHKLLVLAIILSSSFSCANRARLTKADRMTPQPSSPMFKQQVNNAVYMGDGDLVVKALRQKMAADPDNLKVRVELAEHFRKIGYPELALEHSRLAAQRFPDAGELYLLMAKSLNDLGMKVEAADTLQKFLERKPQTDPAFYSWLGILRDALGQWKAGESNHRAALTLANLDYLHNNLGYNLLQQGKKDQAAAEFRKALALRSNSAVARNNLGLAVASNPKEALANWQSASGPAAAHNNLASVLIEQGKYAEARKELEKALEYNRSDPTILGNLRLVSEIQGRPVVLPSEEQGSRMRRALGSTWRAVSGAPPKGKTEKEALPVGTASN